MPRKRYPSDESRLKRPSGINVAFSVLNPDPDKPGQAECFSDPQKRGIWVWLLLLAGRAYAGRTGDVLTLTDGELSLCTGRAQRRHSLSSLRAVCELMEYSMYDRGHSVVVHVKNLSQNQGWTTRNSAESDAESAELPPPPKTSTKTSTKTIKDTPLSSATRGGRASISLDEAEGNPYGYLEPLLALVKSKPGNPREKQLWLESQAPELLAAAAERAEEKSVPLHSAAKRLVSSWYAAYLRRGKTHGHASEKDLREFQLAEQREYLAVQREKRRLVREAEMQDLLKRKANGEDVYIPQKPPNEVI